MRHVVKVMSVTSVFAGRAYASSEDGFSSGRPGEVEMQDLHSNSGSSMQRRPSLPELNSYAGERKGAAQYARRCAAAGGACCRASPVST
jgi:hypothetical protein